MLRSWILVLLTSMPAPANDSRVTFEEKVEGGAGVMLIPVVPLLLLRSVIGLRQGIRDLPFGSVGPLSCLCVLIETDTAVLCCGRESASGSNSKGGATQPASSGIEW
jgi:hypothetical protein